MRKPLGLFVAAFATVAGGAAAAQVGDPSTSTTDSTTTTSESTTSTETTATTEPTTTTVEVEDPTDADALVEGEGGEHGAWVSDHAQNLCGDDAVDPDTGEAYRNHGECVSRAARDKDHDGTPDVPAEEETVEETETVEPEVEDTEQGAGHRTSDGAGHRDDSPGRGHQRFDG